MTKQQTCWPCGTVDSSTRLLNMSGVAANRSGDVQVRILTGETRYADVV